MRGVTKGMTGSIDAVIIGRNEGARLLACLDSVKGRVRRVVYVDSGSTDGSVAAAQAAGAKVVALDMALPFTAARARNAGLAVLAEDPPEFVCLIDGDCAVQPGWIATALAFLATHPDVVVVCGRRRERFPEASLYNLMCDREWNTPPGEAMACGGDAVMRFAAVQAVGGFRADLIAGEEPELCQRLRRAGGRIWRIDAEMTLHDAAMTRFSQWWRRTRRAGHAFAEGAALHGKGPDRHWVAETRRALIWGLGVPMAAAGLTLLHPAGFALLGLWPAQWLRLTLRQMRKDPPVLAARMAGLSVLGKLPEALGALEFYANRLRGRGARLIEYK
jgi:GT2 family glycosyltransferase